MVIGYFNSHFWRSVSWNGRLKKNFRIRRILEYLWIYYQCMTICRRSRFHAVSCGFILFSLAGVLRSTAENNEKMKKFKLSYLRQFLSVLLHIEMRDISIDIVYIATIFLSLHWKYSSGERRSTPEYDFSPETSKCHFSVNTYPFHLILIQDRTLAIKFQPKYFPTQKKLKRSGFFWEYVIFLKKSKIVYFLYFKSPFHRPKN